MKTDAIKLGAYRSCKSCSAIILYYPTANQKLMPIDAEETPLGNVVLEIDPADRSQTLARVLRSGEACEGRRYTSHFATCTKAAEHRKPRAGEGVR